MIVSFLDTELIFLNIVDFEKEREREREKIMNGCVCFI